MPWRWSLQDVPEQAHWWGCLFPLPSKAPGSMLPPLGRMTALPVTAPVLGFALHFLSRVFESFGEAQNSLCVQEVIALEREEAAARDSPGGLLWQSLPLRCLEPGTRTQESGCECRLFFFLSLFPEPSSLQLDLTPIPTPGHVRPGDLGQPACWSSTPYLPTSSAPNPPPHPDLSCRGGCQTLA